MTVFMLESHVRGVTLYTGYQIWNRPSRSGKHSACGRRPRGTKSYYSRCLLLNSSNPTVQRNQETVLEVWI